MEKSILNSKMRCIIGNVEVAYEDSHADGDVRPEAHLNLAGQPVLPRGQLRQSYSLRKRLLS